MRFKFERENRERSIHLSMHFFNAFCKLIMPLIESLKQISYFYEHSS